VEEVAEAIREGGGEALARCDEAASRDGAHALMQGAVDRFGRIDIVVNNVLPPPENERGRIDEIGRESWQRTLQSSLKAAFCCTRAALGHMRPQRRGRFIHFLSIAGLVGSAGRTHEGAVMMAVAGFSRNVAIEMERYQITSNCMAPHTLPPAAPAPAGGTPGRAGDGFGNRETLPAEAAPLAVFLASDAAGSLSGQLFGVRGKEIYLFSQSRIARSIHHSQGWTVEALAGMVEPAMGTSFTSLETVESCFSWDVMV